MSITATDPVIERIAETLYERLCLLTTGVDTIAPVSEVVRPKKRPSWTPKHQQIIIDQGDSARVEDLDRPGNPPAIAYQSRFNIRIHVIPSDKDPVPLDTAIARMVGGVNRIVTQSTRWFSFGNLSVDAEFLPPVELDAEDGVTGVEYPLLVTYRVSENSPEEARL